MKYFCIISLFFLAGCITAKSLRVESNPTGADVELVIPGQSPKKVGQTPVMLTEFQVGASTSPIQINVSHKGYDSRTLVLPPSSWTRVGSLYFELPQQSLPASYVNPEININKATKGLAEAYGHISGKRLEQAESVLTNLSQEFPNISVFYDLMGNVHYLKKEFSKALRAYQKSNSLNPNNAETNRMIQKLETMKAQGVL